ncbi:hypothetical protein WA158_001137 [Blastocystis sp. Blastoise]
MNTDATKLSEVTAASPDTNVLMTAPLFEPISMIGVTANLLTCSNTVVPSRAVPAATTIPALAEEEQCKVVIGNSMMTEQPTDVKQAHLEVSNMDIQKSTYASYSYVSTM